MTEEMIKKGARKFVRSIFLVAVILALFAVFGLPYIIERFVGTETLSLWILSELTPKIGRQIIVHEAQVSLFDRVDLKGVAISEYGGFKEGIFLEAESAALKFHIWELAWGVFHAHAVEVKNARVKISRDKDGRWNVSDWVKKKEAKPQVLDIEPRQDNLLPVELRVDRVLVENGVFSLKDALKKAPDIEAKNINLEASGFSFGSLFSSKVTLEGKMVLPEASPKIFKLFVDNRDLKLSFDGRFNVAEGLPSKMGSRFGELNIESDQWALKAEGDFFNLLGAGSRGRLKATPIFKNFDLAFSTQPMRLDGEAQVALDWKAIPNQKQAFDISVNAQNLAVSWDDFVRKAAAIPMAAHLKGENEKGKFQGSFFVQAGSARRGGVEAWRLSKQEDKSWKLVLSSGTFHPQGALSLMPWLTPYNLSGGRLKFEEFAFVSGADRWTLSVKGANLSNGYLNERGQKIERIEGALESLSVISRQGKKEVAFEGGLQAQGADTAHIQAREFLAQAQLKGLGGGASDLANGDIHVYLKEGALKNIPDLVKLVGFFKFLITPLTIFESLNKWKIIKLGNADFRSIPIEDFTSEYAFESGKMSFNNLNLKSPYANVETEGWIDLPRDQINILVHVAVDRHKVRWKFADTLADEKGTLYLDVKVSGPLSNPEVLPRAGKRKESANDGAKNLKELKDTMKKFFDLFLWK